MTAQTVGNTTQGDVPGSMSAASYVYHTPVIDFGFWIEYTILNKQPREVSLGTTTPPVNIQIINVVKWILNAGLKLTSGLTIFMHFR